MTPEELLEKRQEWLREKYPNQKDGWTRRQWLEARKAIK